MLYHLNWLHCSPKMHQQFEHIFSMKNIFYKYPYNYTFVEEISRWVIFEHLLHYSFLFYFFFFIVNLVVQCIMYRKKRSPLQDTCICYECPSHNSIVLIFSLYDCKMVLCFVSFVFRSKNVECDIKVVTGGMKCSSFIF